MHERGWSRPFRLRVWGDLACFTRPEMKVERVSYPVMTPSSARGVLEAILWKPEITWRVERIDRLKPPRFVQVRRNEVALKASIDRDAILVQDVRQQRAALMLRDVAYVIHARLALTDKAGPEDPLAKYVAMFDRRARAGQCFQRPCLGCRELAADFRLLAEGEPDPIPDAEAAGDEDLGWVFHHLDRRTRPTVPRFFHARVEAGRMTVPAPESLELRA
jgi:CRISPR-associated protein Cas5d